MTSFWNWLAKSSSDPTEVALTAKGLISTLVPLLLVFVHNPNLNNLPNDVYTVIVALFAVYSAVAVVVGLARKAFVAYSTPVPPQA